MRDDLHDSCAVNSRYFKNCVVSFFAVFFLCFPETLRFSVRNRAQVNKSMCKHVKSQCVNMYVAHKKDYRTVAKFTCNNTHGQES